MPRSGPLPTGRPRAGLSAHVRRPRNKREETRGVRESPRGERQRSSGLLCARNTVKVSVRKRVGWGLFAAADAAVSALFVLGYAARSVPPAVEWRLQLAALALPATAVGTVLTSAVWARWPPKGRVLRWVGVGAHAALVGAAAVRFIPLTTVPLLSEERALTERRETSFRIVSLNAGKGGPPAHALMEGVLDRVRPDLVLFQEAALHRTVVEEVGPVFSAPPPVLAALAAGYRAPESDDESSVTTLTRLPIGTHTAGSLGAAGDESAGRYSRVTLEWDGRDVAVYNVHLRSFNEDRPSMPTPSTDLRDWLQSVEGLRRDFVLRAQEAERLRTLLEEETIPFLVAGDLNSTPHQWVYAAISASLRDAIRMAPGWAPTYPNDRPLVQIDAVFASPEWDVLAAATGPPGLSDHRAVMAEMRLRP